MIELIWDDKVQSVFVSNLLHVYVKSITKIEREKSVYDLNSFQLKGGTERNLKK